MSDSSSELFISREDLITLTGCHHKQAQINVLRQNRIPFFLNASGRPIVTRAAVEGRERTSAEKTEAWQPAVLGLNPKHLRSR